MKISLPGSQLSGSIAARLSVEPHDGTSLEFAVWPSSLVKEFSASESHHLPASADRDAILELPPGVYGVRVLRDGRKGQFAYVVVAPGLRTDVVLDP